MAGWHMTVADGRREQIIAPAGDGQAQFARPAAQPVEMLPGDRFDHPGKPHEAAAAGDVLANVPAVAPIGQSVRVGVGQSFGVGQVFGVVGEAGHVRQTIEQPFQTAAADAIQEQGALHLRPDQQLFRLEEGVEVDEALDVQTHLVVAVDGVQADEGTGSLP